MKKTIVKSPCHRFCSDVSMLAILIPLYDNLLDTYFDVNNCTTFVTLISTSMRLVKTQIRRQRFTASFSLYTLYTLLNEICDFNIRICYVSVIHECDSVSDTVY